MKRIDILAILEATGDYDPSHRLEAELEERLVSLRLARERHAEILRDGAGDPFWSDGCAANLVRHRMLFERGRIEEICRRLGRPVPEDAREVPAAVRPDHVAAQSIAVEE